MGPKNVAAVAGSASPQTEEKKPEQKSALPKIPRKVADDMLKAGEITKAQYDKWLAAGRITSGEGGGEDIFEQMEHAGVPKPAIESLKKALEAVNAALWKDAKTYIGKRPAHKFSFSEGGASFQYEAPAEVEVALWVKHFDPEQKKNREAVQSKKQ